MKLLNLLTKFVPVYKFVRPSCNTFEEAFAVTFYVLTTHNVEKRDDGKYNAAPFEDEK